MLGRPQAGDVPGEPRPGAAPGPGLELSGALGAPRCEPPPKHRVFGGIAGLPCPTLPRAW